MKTRILILVFAALLVAAAGQAQDASVALTPDGALYSIESEPYSKDGQSGTRLVLVEQRDGESTTTVIPATALGGSHTDAALAWDQESATLFVFWKKMPNPFSSELLFCSFRDGEFTEPFSVEEGTFHLRFNLQIAVTHWVREEGETVTRARGLNLHAIWWDQTGYGEAARYAMLTIGQGEVDRIFISDLIDFVGDHRQTEPFELPEGFNRVIFRAAGVSTTPDQSGIHVTFGDWAGNRFQTVDVFPVRGDGVLTVPMGVWRGDLNPPTRVFHDVVFANSVPSVLHGPTGSNGMVFYSWDDEDQLHYTVQNQGGWSAIRTIATGERVSRGAAMSGVRSLLAATE
jgi:hypothetical protein